MELIKSAMRWFGTEANTTTRAEAQSSAAAENQRLREDLALAYRAMAYYNFQEHIVNHLSVIAPARNGNGEVMLIIAFGLHWSQVTASSLLGVDIETGEVVEGEGKVLPAGKQIHLALHRLKAAEGIKCVMHTHQPYVSALACCHARLKNCHQTNMIFHNKIAYDDSYGGIASNEKEGERIAQTFGDKRIVIMANHGVTAIGEKICDVFSDLYTLERACMYQVLAMSTGMKLVEAPDHIAEEVVKVVEVEDPLYNVNGAFFEAMRTIIARMEPDYRS